MSTLMRFKPDFELLLEPVMWLQDAIPDFVQDLCLGLLVAFFLLVLAIAR